MPHAVEMGHRWSIMSVANWPTLAPTWDVVNRAAGGLPFFDSRFITPLLECFGTGDEQIAIAHRGGAPVAAALLSRRTAFSVATFQPSQLPLGPWIVGRGEDGIALASDLQRHLGRRALLLALTQLDPLSQARPLASRRLDTLDYIDTAWVDVTGTYDTYWEARGKNLRANMRKQRSRLQSEGVTLTFESLTDATRMLAAVSDYGRLESAGWKGGQGTAVAPTNAQGRFYASMLQNFAAIGRARVWRLKFNDKLVATDLCIEGGDMLVVLKTAFDAHCGPLSPAFLMRQDAFREVFDDARVCRIEFYGRLMEWHTRWTEQSRTLYHLNFYRWPAIAKLRHGWHRVAGARRCRDASSPALESTA